MNRKIATLLLAVSAAIAQTPDAFTGTWKLNVAKSSPNTGYREGTRTYQPVAGGTRVTYKMTRVDGTPAAGEYTTQCHGAQCTSDAARWTQKGARTVEGVTYENGKLDARYVRTVSADGKTLTIKFYPSTGKKKVTFVEVWEKQ
jgi:hypothetical protein